eukprot:gene2659-3427_t
MYYAFDSVMDNIVYDIGGAYQHGRTCGSAWVPVFTSGYSGRALYLNASTSGFDIHEGVYVDAYSTSASSKFEGMPRIRTLFKGGFRAEYIATEKNAPAQRFTELIGNYGAGAMLGSNHLHLTVDFYFNLELLGHPDGEALLNFAAASTTGLDRDGLSVWLDSASTLWLRRSDEFGVESGDDLLLSASVSYGSWHHIVISTTSLFDMGTTVEVWLDGRQCVAATFSEAARDEAGRGAVYWSLALAKGSYGAVDIGEDALDALFTASTAGIVKRLCSSCATSHREIYYKRLPRRAPISWHGYLASNWSSTANILNVDFELYSTHADALAGANRWTYCNYYSAQGVGFPGECGAAGAVTGQWNTWAPAAGGGAGQDDVAFYVQIDCPCAISTCACKTCTSIRFGDVDPACMEYTQSYCATYSGSDAGCSNFTGRVQRTMTVGTAGGVLNTDTPELLRGRKVVVTIPPNAVSTMTSLTIRELRADEVAAASQHLMTSRWYRAVLSDYISLVPHGSMFADEAQRDAFLEEYVRTIAAAAGVDPEFVNITLIIGLSVIATVEFAWTDMLEADTFQVSLVNHTDAVFDSTGDTYWAAFEPPLVTEAEVVPLPVSPPPPSPPPCPPSPPAPSLPPGGIVLVDAVMAFPGVNLTALLANSTLAAALEDHLMAVFSRAAGVPSSQVSISFNTTAPEGISVTDTGDDEIQAARHNVTWYAIALVTFDWDDLDKAEAFEELLEGSDEHIDGNASAAVNATGAVAHNRSSADNLSSAADTSSTSSVFADDLFWVTLALEPPEESLAAVCGVRAANVTVALGGGSAPAGHADSNASAAPSGHAGVQAASDDATGATTATSWFVSMESRVRVDDGTAVAAEEAGMLLAEASASGALLREVRARVTGADEVHNVSLVEWRVTGTAREDVLMAAGSAATSNGSALIAGNISYHYGEEVVVVLGLQSETPYSVSSVAALELRTADITPPSFASGGYPRITGIRADRVAFVVALTEPGRVYYNVKETPSALHVMLGVTPAAAVASVVKVPAAFEAVTVEVAGLNSESQYTIHLLAEDSATPPNWQAEPSQLQATTLDITPPSIQLHGAASLRVTPNKMLQRYRG